VRVPASNKKANSNKYMLYILSIVKKYKDIRRAYVSEKNIANLGTMKEQLQREK